MPGGTLTVLGCDGSYPGPGGAASGYLIAAGTTSIWVDAGPGTFATLQQVIDPADLDAVVLSHEHPDHWSDIESFAVWRRHHCPDQPCLVLAPPGLQDRSYFGDDPILRWELLEPSFQIALGTLHLRFSPTDHGPPTLAMLVTRTDADPGDRSLAYSADTGPDWTVAELDDHVGLFLCEASYTKDHEGNFRHLSGRQAGSMASSAQVDRLVVTHRWPNIDPGLLAAEASDAFGRAVQQARSGLTVEW
jgi:ribonuclease BN (tRNA processing enzyme)